MTRERNLIKAAEDVLQADERTRIHFVRQDRWIGYTEARGVLAELERLLEYPEVIRPPCLLLTAETNNGKTTILRRFQAQHAVIDDPAAAHVERPVLFMDAPASPDEGRFQNHLLRALGAVYKPSDKTDVKLFQAQELLHRTGVKVLVVDEVSNILAGTATQRQQTFNAMKALGNELRCSVVLAGIFDALAALRSDKQSQNRYVNCNLPRWELDQEFLSLLASFEAVLPLRRASNLASEQLAPLLLLMSGGLIGELSHLLKRASEQAILSGRERITRALLLELKWLPPDERDRAATAVEAGLSYAPDYRARLAHLTRGIEADE